MTSATAETRTGHALEGPVAAAVALGAATVYTYARSPFEAGAFPVCLFYAGTGLYCPGCGGLRAVHTLLHGDALGALQLNALAILFVIPITIVAVTWWAGNAAGKSWPAPRLPAVVWWGLATLVLLFTIARNIPYFAPYLAP